MSRRKCGEQQVSTISVLKPLSAIEQLSQVFGSRFDECSRQMVPVAVNEDVVCNCWAAFVNAEERGDIDESSSSSSRNLLENFVCLFHGVFLLRPRRARGGIRTHTPPRWKGGLSPPRLPVSPPGPGRLPGHPIASVPAGVRHPLYGHPLQRSPAARSFAVTVSGCEGLCGGSCPRPTWGWRRAPRAA